MNDCVAFAKDILVGIYRRFWQIPIIAFWPKKVVVSWRFVCMKNVLSSANLSIGWLSSPYLQCRHEWSQSKHLTLSKKVNKY